MAHGFNIEIFHFAVVCKYNIVYITMAMTIARCLLIYLFLLFPHSLFATAIDLMKISTPLMIIRFTAT